MTCFGYASQKTDYGYLEVSVKSVNGRFLEQRSHLPTEFYKFEAEIKKRVSAVFQRGTVTVYVNRKKDHKLAKANVVVREDLARAFLKSIDQLSKNLKIQNNVSIDRILQLPQVFVLEDDTSVSKIEEKVLFQLLKTALSRAKKEKIREGVALKKDILSHLKVLKALLKSTKAVAHKHHQNLKSLMDIKVQKVDSVTDTVDQRLAQNIVDQMERSDITEEITRFAEHVRSIEKLVKTEKYVGKKLEFYTQELLREMNTIGSKSQLVKITENVVESKSLIEKIREQIQNVE
jgi:uncharacterized protein (TIGR00255 family)